MDGVVLQTQCYKCPKERKKSMVMEQYLLKVMFIIRIKVVKGTCILDGGKKQRFWQTKFSTTNNLHSRLQIQLKSQMSAQGFVETRLNLKCYFKIADQ